MTATMTEDLQEQLLSVVRKSQELTLDAVRKTVEAVSAAQAKLPAATRDFKLPELPTLPFAGKLPKLPALPEPQTVVTSAYDLLSRLLADQRKFAGELIAATSALRPAKAEADSGTDEAGE
jgi:hypothetical protein